MMEWFSASSMGTFCSDRSQECGEAWSVPSASGEGERRADHPERAEDFLLHQLVVGLAQLHARLTRRAPM